MTQRTGVVIGLLAVLIVHALLLWIYHVPGPKPLWGDEQMYRQAALELTETGQTDKNSLWPPLYSGLVAVSFRAGNGSVLPLQLLQTLLLVASALLLRDLCVRLTGERNVADLAALTLLIYPPLVAFAHYLWPEVLHMTLLLGVLWILVARRDRLPWVAGLGLSLGLALLTKSILGPFVPVLLVPLVLDGDRRRGALKVGLAVGVLLLTIAPTIHDNYQRTGSPKIPGSSRFNVWVGLNDTSRKNFVDGIVRTELAEYQASSDDPRQRDRILGEKIAERFRERGVPAILREQLGRQYFRLFDKDSFLTDQLPGGAIANQGRGYRDPASPVAFVLRGGSFLLYAWILAFGAAGVVLIPPSGRRWLWIPLAFLAYNLAIFLFLHVKTRYRIPIMPVLIVYAAMTTTEALAGRIHVDHVRPWRLVAAGTLALLALFLAFGGGWLD